MRKLKFDEVMVAVIALCIIGVMLVGYALWTLLPYEQPIARNVNAPKVPYSVCVSTDAAGGDTPLLVIDLSDSTNFPHTATNEVILRAVYCQGGLDANAQWNIYYGVILENDATDGSTMWMYQHRRTRLANFDEQRSYTDWGLDMRVTSGALVYATSNMELSDSVVFSSGAVITSSVGTSSPGAGDIVVWLDEITDGAVLEYTICVDYDTE